jgi:hypothetical protein
VVACDDVHQLVPLRRIVWAFGEDSRGANNPEQGGDEFLIPLLPEATFLSFRIPISASRKARAMFMALLHCNQGRWDQNIEILLAPCALFASFLSLAAWISRMMKMNDAPRQKKKTGQHHFHTPPLVDRVGRVMWVCLA